MFLYPLKTSENICFSDVFRGYWNGALAWNESRHDLLNTEFNRLRSNSKRLPDAPVCRCSSEKRFLKISQYSQQNTFVGVSFWYRSALKHRCFPSNIAKFLRTAFLVEHLRWLLLDFQRQSPRVVLRGSCFYKKHS